MLEWSRKDPKYNESVFGINFREDEPELAKQLSDEKGFYIDGKTTTRGNWTFKAKKVTAKKDGKEYWFVERFIGQGASNEDGAKKGHQENVEMHKAQMAKLDLLIVAIQNQTESTNTAIELQRRQNELLEIITKNGMKGKTFEQADKLEE